MKSSDESFAVQIKVGPFPTMKRSVAFDAARAALVLMTEPHDAKSFDKAMSAKSLETWRDLGFDANGIPYGIIGGSSATALTVDLETVITTLSTTLANVLTGVHQAPVHSMWSRMGAVVSDMAIRAELTNIINRTLSNTAEMFDWKLNDWNFIEVESKKDASRARYRVKARGGRPKVTVKVQLAIDAVFDAPVLGLINGSEVSTTRSQVKIPVIVQIKGETKVKEVPFAEACNKLAKASKPKVRNAEPSTAEME